MLSPDGISSLLCVSNSLISAIERLRLNMSLTDHNSWLWSCNATTKETQNPIVQNRYQDAAHYVTSSSPANQVKGQHIHVYWIGHYSRPLQGNTLWTRKGILFLNSSVICLHFDCLEPGTTEYTFNYKLPHVTKEGSHVTKEGSRVTKEALM